MVSGQSLHSEGWRPKTECDEACFCRSLVESLEDAENILGEVSTEDMSKKWPKAARSFEFESARGGNKAVRKTLEHLEAEKNLRGKEGEEAARRRLSKHRRKFKAQRIVEETKKAKTNQDMCKSLFCGKEEGPTDDR